MTNLEVHPADKSLKINNLGAVYMEGVLTLPQ
ncbi:hypothetical protein HDF14_002228 [Edaphobacter lichenicola]|uniref:Uncharacterized protein n=1 Tax=Tunturiibacter gelidiferens TaxID=3069689 RepID=A0A9X0QE56_9BACT|nr:hypothetical protein [Edaphobacter lichenicola]